MAGDSPRTQRRQCDFGSSDLQITPKINTLLSGEERGRCLSMCLSRRFHLAPSDVQMVLGAHKSSSINP